MNSQVKKIEKQTLEFKELSLTESLSISEMSRVHGGALSMPAVPAAPAHGLSVPAAPGGALQAVQ